MRTAFSFRSANPPSWLRAPHVRRVHRLIVAGFSATALLLGACGQRGPLYLPNTGVQTNTGPVRSITATPLLATPPLTSDPAAAEPGAQTEEQPPTQEAPANPASGQAPAKVANPVHP